MLNNYHFLPADDILKTKSFIVYNFMNKFWVVHPKKGLAFYNKGFGSPQCNNNEDIAKRLCPEWGMIVFIERVLVPCNVNDYKD